MRLSEAMMLGDTLRTRRWCIYLSPDKSCGCAIGGAVLAIGEGDSFLDSLRLSSEQLETFARYWPWLENEHIYTISQKFHDVCYGEQTFEELIDYVRSIEPDEDEEIPERVIGALDSAADVQSPLESAVFF